MRNLFDLTGRAALVTGGSRGLGKEMAMALAEAGADLLLGAQKAGPVKQAAEEIAAHTGKTVLAQALDVADRTSVEAFVSTAMERFKRIDILVNSAGVNVRAPTLEVRDEDWLRINQVNVTGTFFCCRAALPHMLQAGFGRIINVGSALSLAGMPGRLSYCTSKGAVIQMTRAMAVELARTGVTVNCLCPGPFATEINRPLLDNPQAAADLMARIPMARWAEMHEIRTPVLFLASPASSYVTGSALLVDGGWTAW